MKTRYTPEEMRAIGNRIKFARRARGLNQGQLCDRAHIPSIKLVSKFELGLDVPKGERLKLIAKALGVTEDYILKGEVKVKVEQTTDTRRQATAILFTKKEEKTEKAPERPVPWDGFYWAKGAYLKELRNKNKLTLHDVAELVGFCGKRSTIDTKVYAWEKGKCRIAKQNLDTLSHLYGVSFDELVDWEKPIPPKPAGRAANLIRYREQKATDATLNKEVKEMEKTVNTKTPITVTEEVKETREVPRNAEQVFMMNVKAYLVERGTDISRFEKEIGAEDGYIDLVIKHNPKIPLSVAIDISRKLGKSIEDLATDTKALRVQQQIEELEKQMAILKASIGMV